MIHNADERISLDAYNLVSHGLDESEIHAEESSKNPAA